MMSQVPLTLHQQGGSQAKQVFKGVNTAQSRSQPVLIILHRCRVKFQQPENIAPQQISQFDNIDKLNLSYIIQQGSDRFPGIVQPAQLGLGGCHHKEDVSHQPGIMVFPGRCQHRAGDFQRHIMLPHAVLRSGQNIAPIKPQNGAPQFQALLNNLTGFSFSFARPAQPGIGNCQPNPGKQPGRAGTNRFLVFAQSSCSSPRAQRFAVASQLPQAQSPAALRLHQFIIILNRLQVRHGALNIDQSLRRLMFHRIGICHTTQRTAHHQRAAPLFTRLK